MNSYIKELIEQHIIVTGMSIYALYDIYISPKDIRKDMIINRAETRDIRGACSYPCFKLGKQLNRKPEEIAVELANMNNALMLCCNKYFEYGKKMQDEMSNIQKKHRKS